MKLKVLPVGIELNGNLINKARAFGNVYQSLLLGSKKRREFFILIESTILILMLKLQKFKSKN